MKIYEVHVDYDNGYETCCIDEEACRKIPGNENKKNWEFDIELDGTEQKEKWWSRKIVPRGEDDGSIKHVGDFTAMLGTGMMAIERRAIKKLESVLENVEILPLDCSFGDYSVINVLNVLDCLDYEKSVYDTIDAEKIDGKPFILNIEKYCLKKDIVQGYKIFKIYDFVKSSIYVNEEFVEAVQTHQITGFNFELIWESS